MPWACNRLLCGLGVFAVIFFRTLNDATFVLFVSFVVKIGNPFKLECLERSLGHLKIAK